MGSLSPPVLSPVVVSPQTIGEKQAADYKASRPYQTLYEEKGWQKLNPDQKVAYNNERILESKSYLSWEPQLQKDFLNLCRSQSISHPLPFPPDLGVDRKGRPVSSYTLEEFASYEREQRDLQYAKDLSWLYRLKVTRSRRAARQSAFESVPSEAEVKGEKHRRAQISAMETGKKIGRYAGDPAWDDIDPIEQDDGSNPLAAIAYTDEYAEGMLPQHYL